MEYRRTATGEHRGQPPCGYQRPRHPYAICNVRVAIRRSAAFAVRESGLGERSNPRLPPQTSPGPALSFGTERRRGHPPLFKGGTFAASVPPCVPHDQGALQSAEPIGALEGSERSTSPIERLDSPLRAAFPSTRLRNS